MMPHGTRRAFGASSGRAAALGRSSSLGAGSSAVCSMPNADPAVIAAPKRLAAVAATGLLDSPASPALNRLTRLTTQLLGVPSSVVTLIDRNRQVFAGSSDDEDGVIRKRETPLDYSFCQHVVAQAAPLVVTNARQHPLVHDNLGLLEDGVMAYAGMPLIDSGGQALGSFCAFDTKPHEWSERDLQILQDLAQAAMTEIELRFAGRLLEEQGEQLRALLDNTDELVARFGLDGALTYANAAWRRLLGDPPPVPIAGYLQSKLTGVGREVFETAWTDAQVGEPSEDIELGFVLPNGDSALVSLRLVPVLTQGVARGIRVYGHDVTELRRAEQAKDQVISLVSHELRTPIGAVQGAMQLLEKLLPQPVPPKVSELVALAKRNADRLLALVTDLLDLDRLEAGSAPFEMAAHPMSAVFATARDATAPLAERKGIVLEFGPDAAVVYGDEKWLVHVVINLVGNALKFTPEGGRVRAYCLADEGQVQVRVTDNGRGIPPEEAGRIFERFAQVQRADATEKGGSGLGLAIAKAIVLQHGGRIWVESEVGKGTTFAFTVPSAPR
ncbi:MAG: hypothetical protein C0503_00880 [Gemmatimonas sp.]|nr:hypothetical protein [Gemmatimonas sp.]